MRNPPSPYASMICLPWGISGVTSMSSSFPLRSACASLCSAGRALAGFLGGALVVAADLGVPQVEQSGGRDADAGIGADEDAPHQGDREAVQHRAAEQEQRE